MFHQKKFYVILGLFLILTVTAGSSLYAEKEKDNNLTVEMGKLLTEEFGCVDCHTPKIMRNNYLINDPDRLFSGHPEDKILPQFPPEIIGPDKWRGLFTDSMTAWGGPWGISYSANLTPDNETGIGKLSEKNFVSVLSLGIHSGMNRKLMQPMPWKETSALREEDLNAIYVYLRTVEPIKNKVPDSVPLYSHEDMAAK